MAKAIYLTASELTSGKSLIALGIIEVILRSTTNVGVYRPIINKKNKNAQDSLINLLMEHFNLNQDYDSAFSYYRKEAIELMQKHDWEDVLDKIIQDYKSLEKKYDFILVIGTDLKKDLQAVDTNINVNIVKNLNIPVLIVGRGDNGQQVDEIIEPAVNHANQFIDEDCELTGVIISSAHSELSHEILVKLRNTLSLEDVIFAVIPISRTIRNPTVGEIAHQVGAKVLFGGDYLDNPVFKYTIAAMKPEHFLEKLGENCLVMTPGDRDDVLLAVLQAHRSKNYPNVAGILLSTGFKPKPAILKLIDGLSNIIPILLVNTNTFETALNLEHVESTITTKYPKKITKAIHIFEKYVNVSSLEKRLSNIKPKGITPRMFQYEMAEKAKKKKKRIVLPEGLDPRIIQATSILMSKEVVSITLLGEEEKIRKKAIKMGVDLDFNGLEIINPKKSDYISSFVKEFVKLRKHKGANETIAIDTMADASYFGTMMVHLGHADGMVSGAVNTTAHTIRPALQLIKTKDDVSVVSSVFFMCMQDRVLVYGDCAINPTPNAEQLSQIAIASAKTARDFGITPLVSLLSYSSGDSGSGADVDKVREAAAILKKQNVDFEFEGPIQYDAAVDPTVAKTKMPNSKVAGRSNVLTFPDLNTGNNTYKAVQRETGAIAIGPILQGLRKPVNDLSRGCTVTDIVNTVIITVNQTS